MDITEQPLSEMSLATESLLNSYRSYIRQQTLTEWSELTWLNRFLRTNVGTDVDKTSVYVLTLHDQRLVSHEVQFDAKSLHAELWYPSIVSRLRVVLVCHGRSWDVDRDMIDVVAARYDLDPRFLMRHFDYKNCSLEEHCPPDIKEEVKKMNRLQEPDRYGWNLGGDLVNLNPLGSQTSLKLDFGSEALSCTLMEEDSSMSGEIYPVFILHSLWALFRLTMLVIVFIRALTESTDSSLLLERPSMRSPGTRRMPIQSQKSLAERYLYLLQRLELGENDHIQQDVTQVCLPLVKCLVAEYTSVYLRRFAARPMESLFNHSTCRGTIKNHVLNLGAACREFDAFFVPKLEGRSYDNATQQEARFLQSNLNGLYSDFQNVQASYRRRDKRYDAATLNEIMEAQTEEARTSTETSLKIGWLTKIAFFFIPLQLTTSSLGMNLQAFGNGSVQISTFVSLAFGITICAMLPVLWKLSGVDGEIIRRLFWIARCSPEAAFIYGIILMFEMHEINRWLSRNQSNHLSHWVWYSGMHYDIARRFDSAEMPKRTHAENANRRKEILNNVKLRFSCLPQASWQRMLTRLFDITDNPDWTKPRKRDNEHNE